MKTDQKQWNRRLKTGKINTLYLRKPPYSIERDVFELALPATVTLPHELNIMAWRRGKYRKAGRFRTHIIRSIPATELTSVHNFPWLAEQRPLSTPITEIWIQERLQPHERANIYQFIRIPQ